MKWIKLYFDLCLKCKVNIPKNSQKELFEMFETNEYGYLSEYKDINIVEQDLKKLEKFENV